MSPPVASGGGFLVIFPKKNHFLRLTWEDKMSQKALFLWNQPPEFSRSPLLQSHHRSIAGVSVDLKSEPVSRVSVPC